MKVSNVKRFKSTILGIVFILTGLYLMVDGVTTDYWILGSLEVGGILLLFSGDRFINRLKKYVFGKVLLENKTDGD